jgi:hypothetical protein
MLALLFFSSQTVYGKQEIQVNKILVDQLQIAMEHHMTALQMKSTGA